MGSQSFWNAGMGKEMPLVLGQFPHTRSHTCCETLSASMPCPAPRQVFAHIKKSSGAPDVAQHAQHEFSPLLRVEGAKRKPWSSIESWWRP